jgi:protein-S-isoprenylcysteine O-methyltransferase Ste14
MTLALSAACQFSFAWAAVRHFRRLGAMPAGMRRLTLANAAAYAIFVAVMTDHAPRPWTRTVALVLFAASGLLFWWTVAETRRAPPPVAHDALGSTTLHATGPYALVRHPFYAAYIVFWLATALEAGPLQFAPAAFVIAWYVVLARQEERELDAGPFGPAYRAYRARTVMLVPNPLRGLARRRPPAEPDRRSEPSPR